MSPSLYTVAGDLTTGMASRVSIDQLRAEEEQQCDEFVRSSPSGTFCHLSGWRRVVEDVLGHPCYCFVARNERGISGVFPIGRVRNALFGDCLVSIPLAVYGGICADDEDSYFGLLNSVPSSESPTTGTPC